MMYQRLYGQSPVGLPGNLSLKPGERAAVDLPDPTARLLQEAAAEANLKYGKP